MALVLAVAVTAAACGGDDSGDTEASEETVDVESMTEDPSTTEAGSTDETEPSDGTVEAGGDPCDVLAGIDVAALVGEPVLDPDGSDDLMGATCLVDPVSDSSAGLRVVVSDQEPSDNFENQRETFGVDSDVAGLGDKAFHSGPYLFVLDDDLLVMIQVVRDADTGFNVPDAELEAAMTTILTNLGR